MINLNTQVYEMHDGSSASVGNRALMYLKIMTVKDSTDPTPNKTYHYNKNVYSVKLTLGKRINQFNEFFYRFNDRIAHAELSVVNSNTLFLVLYKKQRLGRNGGWTAKEKYHMEKMTFNKHMVT